MQRMVSKMKPFMLAIFFVITSVFCQDVEIIRLRHSLQTSFESVNSIHNYDSYWGRFEKRSTDYKTPKTGMIPKDSSSRRPKRNVINLWNMIDCATYSCCPLQYLNYGCYCGLSFGDPEYTVDEIDSCCQQHDRCYARTGCRLATEYWFPYAWECLSGREPKCDSDQGFWAWLFRVKSCTQKVCECDRVLAKCLQQYPCPETKRSCRRQEDYDDENYGSRNVNTNTEKSYPEKDSSVESSGSGDYNDIRDHDDEDSNAENSGSGDFFLSETENDID